MIRSCNDRTRLFLFPFIFYSPRPSGSWGIEKIKEIEPAAGLGGVLAGQAQYCLSLATPYVLDVWYNGGTGKTA
jgi:hypothetical protein